MTRYEVYAVLLAVVQLVVSGLGFIVVAWTLRVLVRSIDAQSSAGVASRQLEFDKVILTYPCLYKYFYQGHNINSDEPEYPRAMAHLATRQLLRWLLPAAGHVPTNVARQEVERLYPGSR